MPETATIRDVTDSLVEQSLEVGCSGANARLIGTDAQAAPREAPRSPVTRPQSLLRADDRDGQRFGASNAATFGSPLRSAEVRGSPLTTPSLR